MPEIKPNVELLQRTLAHIEASPETWVQAFFRCRTGMCFAGWAATFAGGQWVVEDLSGLPMSDDAEYMIAEPDDRCYDNGKVWVFDRARRVLGLNQLQASRLFASRNRIDDLRRIVGGLCREAS